MRTLALAHPQPFDASSWFRHVADRAVPGLETASPPGPAPGSEATVRRLVRGATGPVLATLRLARDGSRVEIDLDATTPPDLEPALARVRRWLDLDTDAAGIVAELASDPFLAPLVAARPGLRIPGTTDSFELAVRAVLGQQVSTAAARTVAGRLVAAHGAPGPADLSLFPAPETLAGVPVEDLRALGLTTSRATTIGVLARAVADGLALDPDGDRAAARAALLALPGIGPWTADYVALRALADPDVFPAGDLVLRYALAQLPGGAGAPVDVRAAARRALVWQPWRGYAAQHLWSAWAAQASAPAAHR